MNNAEEFNISEKTCVFIMLQNGMLHWDIAFSMYKKGIDRVVFLPMRRKHCPNDIQNILIEQYNYMLEGNYALMRIPYLTEKIFEQIDRKPYRIVRRLNNGELIVWIPVDMVRTAMREPRLYRDIPIADFIPYINLFLYLSGVESEISEYITIYGKMPDTMSKEDARYNVIKKRRALFDFFEENFNTGNFDYFLTAAPRAEWNESGYVNLCEGQHRCVYLMSKGMKRIPVRMTEETIEKLNEIF